MAVLFADRTLGLRRREPDVEDALGDRIPAGDGVDVGSGPGRARELPDGSWLLGLDPGLWPVREDDLVYDTAAGMRWVVRSCSLLRNTVEPSVDYVRVEAAEMRTGGAEPVGAEFVGRSG